MSAVLAEIAYAKINLALHVRWREPDGYHRIETLFTFAEDGDRLSALPGDTLSLEVIGPFAADLAGAGDNLVMRAATMLCNRFGISDGAKICLDKQLPVAAGIGGGSADAAAAIRLFARMWSIDERDPRIADIARSLGADVPACLLSRTVRGNGRGDELVPVSGEGLSGMPILLVNPCVPVATGPVFAGWDGEDRGPLPQGEPLEAARAGRNDLFASACTIAPIIRDVVAHLENTADVDFVRMSGSGATCFALYRNDALCESAANRIMTAKPDWWCLKTVLR